MGWDEIYQNMCFQPDKHEFARRANIRDAVVTLHLYIQGRSRRYEVLDALDTLSGLGAPVALFKSILDIEDEDYRNMVALECIQKIERFLHL